jgi:hypothetical protein
VAAVASTGADLVDFTVVDFTVVDFTVAGFMVASTEVGFTGMDFTMVDSMTVDFTITDFFSEDRLDIPGGAITRTMGITITANPTPRRLGTTVPILPAITLM